jgi:L-rhamnose isomerase/sugar isomerase
MATLSDTQIQGVISELNNFQIETPSWGFADTGTRFGKFFQDAAAIDLGDKLADAGQVHAFTGCCPTVAVHVLWDFKPGEDPRAAVELAKKFGVSIGAINPNLFQDQEYKYGSFGNPRADVRQSALNHVIDSIEIGKKVGSSLISLWFADGTNYPGQGDIRARKRFFEENLAAAHAQLAPDQLLLVEYKPFEPAFYHTDVADWGMAYILAKKAGPQAKVLVDTGHHYVSQNIEQIVAWLLDEKMLGGFHFNDRRYADDDLTLGSIDPYQIFRIFNEILFHRFSTGKTDGISYVIDQSHNDKPKIEATLQTVCIAQELYAKATLVDHKTLDSLRQRERHIEAEELLRRAFFTDVLPALQAWRQLRKLAPDPLAAYRESGYVERTGKERKARREALGLKTAVAYA